MYTIASNNFKQSMFHLGIEIILFLFTRLSSEKLAFKGRKISKKLSIEIK